MVIANFKTNETETSVAGLWKWDYGQTLRIQGLSLPKAVEIHFSFDQTSGASITRIGTTKDGTTDIAIPDSMLENESKNENYCFYAFIYVREAEAGETLYKITFYVKSRPKPEAFDRPEDSEIFKEAIKAVNDSADRASLSEKNAAASAQEAAKIKDSVQDMVDTIGNIDEQVQVVKEFTQKAETASTNAALSEKAAKESKEAAELSKTAAENAESNANTSKESAELAAQAAKKSEQEAGKVVQQFNASAEEQLKKVVDAGATQIQNIRTVGAEETEKVQQAAAGIVADRQQIQQNKEDAAKLKEDIVKKLDKNQGAENNGKILGIGADGMLVPVDKPSGGTGGEKDYELISEIITSQEVSIIEFKDFLKPIKEFIFYITCPKSEPISIYIQRVFKNSKFGKTAILYNISATDKEIDTYVKGEIIAEKVEILENITSKWNDGNLQINYYNTYEDKTQISVGSYAKLSLICTNQFKIPIGTKITLLGK